MDTARIEAKVRRNNTHDCFDLFNTSFIPCVYVMHRLVARWPSRKPTPVEHLMALAMVVLLYTKYLLRAFSDLNQTPQRGWWVVFRIRIGK